MGLVVDGKGSIFDDRREKDRRDKKKTKKVAEDRREKDRRQEKDKK